jgi:hypothetical protein
MRQKQEAGRCTYSPLCNVFWGEREREKIEVE